jgi:hypothetical protein
MKNILIILWAGAAIALGGFSLVQYRKDSEHQARAGDLRTEVEQKSAEIESLQLAQERAERQGRELKDQTEKLAAQLQARTVGETNVVKVASDDPASAPQPKQPDAPNGEFGKSFNKMMQDPEMLKLVRQQQRMMMDQLYAPLVKRMGLTPEEAAQFKDMQADNVVNAAGKAFSMFGGAADAGQAGDSKSLAADQKSFDARMRVFLGDARYAQYEAYQETAAQRMQLNAFQQQARSDYNLTEPQTEALLAIMKEEAKNVAAAGGLALEGADKDPAKIKALLTDGKMDELLQSQETVNQRIYERARTFLAPGQLAAFGTFRTNQLQMMRVGLNMAKKMFTTDTAASTLAR